MSTTTLDHSWQLCRLDDAGTNGWNALLHAFDGVEGVYPIKRFPMQVHDVLLEQGVIETPNERGINRDTWIHDKDWAYLCRFRAKTGLPSRAEITDAAMGERAECVMLNKGPHITEAMRTLHDILRRMQAHQSKKRPLLRALRAWDPSEGEPPTAG